MGILKRLRSRISALTDVASLPDGSSEHYALDAAVPLGSAGEPLWRVRVQLVSEPQADGEKLRLRAHLQTNFASALRPALQARSDHAQPALGQFSDSRALRLGERAGQLVQRTAQRALQRPVLRALVEPLLQLDLNTWIEIQASTASLDAGSRDLLPQSQRLATLGIQPKPAGAQPSAESWAGEAPDGYAQVTVLQMDRRHLPPRLQDLLGERPFSLAAAVVNTAQRK